LPSLVAGQGNIYWSERGGLWRAPLEEPFGARLTQAFDVRGIAIDASALVWSDVEPRVPIAPTGVVRSTGPSEGNVQDLATELPQPSGVAIDSASQTIYWSDLEQNAIYRRSLDGTGPIQEVFGGMAFVSSIHAIDIDPLEQKLYLGYVNPLIDSLFPGSIARINLDGTKFESVVSGLTEPRGVAVDPKHGHVYWTDSPADGGGFVRRAATEGGEIEDLVSGILLPRGLDLDLARSQVYWADAAAGKIQRADLDGNHVTDVFMGLDQPQAVAIFSVPEPSSLLVVGILLALLICAPAIHRHRSDKWTQSMYIEPT
jgi:sugar lactone lactonase YvrE